MCNHPSQTAFGTGTLPHGQLLEVARGVHAWIQPDGSWWINNAGAIIGDQDILLVDTCATAARTQRFLDAVHAVSAGAEIRIAVNTHEHGDHTFGNALLPEATAIIGHRETRRGVLADTVLNATPNLWEPLPQWGIDQHRAPTVIPDGDLTIHVEDRRIVVAHPGYAAHTAGDLVAWLPDEQVLFSGDLLFHTVTPLVFGGSLDGALRSLDWIADFGAGHIIPGHGPIIYGDQIDAVLDDHARYYRFVIDAAHQARGKGLSPLEAARNCDLGEFADWPDSERLVLNLHRAYCDTDGRDLNIMAAFADAVALNNGPMHSAV